MPSSSALPPLIQLGDNEPSKKGFCFKLEQVTKVENDLHRPSHQLGNNYIALISHRKEENAGSKGAKRNQQFVLVHCYQSSSLTLYCETRVVEGSDWCI